VEFINQIKKQKTMKKLILLLLVSFSLNSFSQQSTLEWHTDMNKAIEISVKTQKPMLLFFTGSDWCGWCKRLVKEVYDKPEFAKWAKNNVVLVEIDFPRRSKLSEETQKQNRELQQMFGVRGYPTIWFVKPETKNQASVNLSQLGSTGYVAGGPTKWIESAEKILSNK
tara:strand:- start:1660 stop:2163 length:504 start_codon:yes stop_codon:yes gene_type:complete